MFLEECGVIVVNRGVNKVMSEWCVAFYSYFIEEKLHNNIITSLIPQVIDDEWSLERVFWVSLLASELHFHETSRCWPHPIESTRPCAEQSTPRAWTPWWRNLCKTWNSTVFTQVCFLLSTTRWKTYEKCHGWKHNRSDWQWYERSRQTSRDSWSHRHSVLEEFRTRLPK